MLSDVIVICDVRNVDFGWHQDAGYRLRTDDILMIDAVTTSFSAFDAYILRRRDIRYAMQIVGQSLNVHTRCRRNTSAGTLLNLTF